MRLKTAIATFFFAAMACLALPASAVHSSQLKVVQEAAQTGLWTLAASGSFEGLRVPNSGVTACMTRDEVLQRLSVALSSNAAASPQSCPVELVVGTRAGGVPRSACAAPRSGIALNLVQSPGAWQEASFQKVGKDQWVSHWADLTVHYKFQGAATAGCVESR